MEIIDGFIGFLHYLLSFALIISVVVFVHEYGHYWVARRAGVRVLAFSIGFGKELFGYTTKSGTRWKVCAIPLGGYVKMFGDSDPTSAPDYDKLEGMTQADRDAAFHYKPLKSKAAIVFAGPFVNFVVGILLLTGLYMWQGQAVTLPEVAGLVEGGAAQRAGMQTGDRVVEIDGEKINRFSDLQRIIGMNPDTDLHFVLDRQGQRVEMTLRPEVMEIENVFGETQKVGRVGIISGKFEHRELGPAGAFGAALEETWHICYYTPKALWEIITGKRSAKELGGPVRIAKYSGQSVERGFGFTLWFIAMLSINLGLINLFPIPPLDGGHLMYYAIEAIRGRPMAEKYQLYGFRAGFIFLIGLMLFATANDILQLAPMPR